MDFQSNTLGNGVQAEGPWGGLGGSEWSYKPQCGYITQITIGYSNRVIESITFQTQDGTKTEKFGGDSGRAPPNKATINIDYPGEFLTGISGYTYRMDGLLVVGSLKLYTNRKEYGPFGQQSGNLFSFRPKEDGAMIIGFFGRSGFYMDAIGVYHKPCVKVPLIEDNSACIKECQSSSSCNEEKSEGPWGGPRGNEWSYKPQCGYIRQITIGYSDRAIESITFQTQDGIKTEKFGGGSGQAPAKKVTVNIDSSNEFLTGISGYTYRMSELSTPSVVLRSLKLYTNCKEYGPFGRESGDPFSFRPKEDGAMITGFFGRAGWYMDAIGVYYKPGVKDCQSSSLCNEVKSEGPWGGPRGNEWSYKPQGGNIKQITVGYSHRVIESITFQSKDGKTEKFGGGSGQGPTNKVNIYIDYPNEFLTGISGYTYRMTNLSIPTDVVGSLRFQTNRKQYGPFGLESGNKFSFQIKEDGEMISGFFGRAGWYIDAIGVYYKPFEKESYDDLKVQKQGPWGGEHGQVFDDGVFSKIKQVHVHLGTNNNGISAVQFEYVNKQGSAQWSSMHGTCGASLARIEINSANEFLTGIQGFYGPIEGVVGTEGCYGASQGSGGLEGFQAPGQMSSGLEGFHGPGQGITGIEGFHGPGQGSGGLVGFQGPNQGSGGLVGFQGPNQGSGGLVGFQGPNQGSGGLAGFRGPNQGSGGLEGFHGPNQGSGGLEGCHGPSHGSGGINVVKSLTFITNKGKYGSLGRETGKSFNSAVDNSKVVGFFGNYGEYLNAIGVHTKCV